MDKKEIDKNLRSYAKYYRKILENEGIDNADERMIFP